MDIQHLVDRLEDLIDDGRHIPLSKYTMIDEERALEIIDQMRISIPEEIEKSRRIIQQRDRLMAQANEESDRLVTLARQKGDDMVMREAVTQAAQNRAANIIEQARQEAEEMRLDADQYVAEVLQTLERELIRFLTVVRNGMSVVSREQAQPVPPVQASATLPQQQPVEVMIGDQYDG
ncbi:MAG: hypothetical protein JW910_06280 [Anaerolineae bacterium]|nr:hypothetical protein [Anaerolineae bacterium]